MGQSGARYSEAVGTVADELVERMGALGPVSWKKMFGGAGVFVEGKMFALVDPEARVHLKVGASNQGRFDAAGSTKHGRMPYFTVPDGVLADDEALLEWAGESAELARQS
jgi:DNA transformation protein